MPVDVRKLIFSKKELRLTFQRFCLDQSMNVPDGPVEDILVVEDIPDEVRVILNYPTDNPSNPVRVHLRHDQIMEALLGFCRALKIPVPRQAQKHLHKHGEGLAVTIGMSEQDMLAARHNARR
ncbi:MAG: hypothetical protein HQL36_11505 [Alphaproteobacteria bacterium]|nr:hypothetical protein [Alphaproteobacteria bacterium]